jgi:hypothetical protein
MKATEAERQALKDNPVLRGSVQYALDTLEYGIDPETAAEWKKFFKTALEDSEERKPKRKK